MIVEVEMVAFVDYGLREVEIPDREAVRKPKDKLLELVVHYGQNDFQPKPYPSVSAGDVIRLEGRRYLVQALGFKEIDAMEKGGWANGYGFSDR